MTDQPPPYTPQYPAQYYPNAPQPKATLGIVAFVVGLVVILLSPIASVIVGQAVGGFEHPGEGFSASFAAGENSHNLGAGLLIFAQIGLGTLLGVWALVQGIVAARMRRGRGWGIVAIVLAGAAPILSFVVYLIAIGVAETAASR